MPINPIVEELILAGRTPPDAVAAFQMKVKKHNIHGCFPNPNTGKIDPAGIFYNFGTIRIAPPLKVPERFRAFVTWLPTDQM